MFGGLDGSDKSSRTPIGVDGAGASDVNAYVASDACTSGIGATAANEPDIFKWKYVIWSP
jgi:hypothetical protein